MRTILRIFSIVIYLFLAAFFKIKLQKVTNRYNEKKILFLYLIIIVILSYFFYSYYEIDLNRLQQRLNVFSNLSFDMFLRNVVTVTNYSEYTYFFLISRLGNPDLLQSITAFIFYSIMFYIMYDYYQTKQLSNASLGNAVFIFMLCGPFIGVISGIRTYLAIVLIFLCIYKEFIKNKNPLMNVPVYIVAIGMHNSVLPIVIIRFVCLIFQREKKVSYQLFNVLVSIVLFVLFVKNGEEIINYTYNRANLYLENNVYLNIYGYAVAIINFLIIFLFFITFKKEVKKNFELHKYVKFLFLIIITTFVFIMQYSIFTRYMGAIFIFSIPVFMYLYDLLSKLENSVYKHNFYFIYYVLLFINVLIFYFFGDNSLINFFSI